MGSKVLVFFGGGGLGAEERGVQTFSPLARSVNKLEQGCRHSPGPPTSGSDVEGWSSVSSGVQSIDLF